MLSRVLSSRVLVCAARPARVAVLAAPRFIPRSSLRLLSTEQQPPAGEAQAPRRSPRKGPTSSGGKKESGVVKWFNQQKVKSAELFASFFTLFFVVQGYGFVTRDNGEGDVFVHFTEIVGTGFRTLEENQKVTFEVGQGPKGVQAQASFLVLFCVCSFCC